MPTNSSVLSLIIPFAIASVFLFLRIRRMRNGTKVNAARTVVFSIVLAGISIFLTVNSFSLGVPPVYGILYGAIFAASAYVSYHYSNRVLDFWQTEDGSIYAKGGKAIFVFYIASTMARIAISSVIGGPQGSLGSQPAATVSSDGVLAAMVFDGLLMAGTALLVGRNARILKRYRRIKKGLDAVRRQQE